MDDRLYRSRDERMIAGVAGGLAERLDLDPSLVRIIWAVLVLPTGFLALLVYVIMAMVVPEEPPDVGLAPPAPAPTGDAAGTGGQVSEAAPPAVPLDWRAQRRAERRARRAARGGGGNGAIVFGAILVVVGALFLVRQFLPDFDFDLVWPIALIVLGAALILGSVRRA
jgi:phage shock protein C